MKDPRIGNNEIADLHTAIRSFNRTARDLERSYESLKQEKERLEEALAQKNRLAEMGEMASVIAHQIRNPLNGISGFGNLILERVDHGDGRDVGRYARQIVTASRKLERLVSGLLQFARTERGVASNVDLGTLVSETIRDVFVADERVGGAAYIPPRERIHAQADPVRLREAVRNVMQNARDATRNGGAVRAHLSREGSWARIRVHDCGPGMGEDTLERVFHPFFTTKEDGYGLGLPIARKMVESQGGSIRLRSAPGRGCRVTIRLPVTGEDGTNGSGQDPDRR